MMSKDQQMEARAIIERWPITDTQRQQIIDMLLVEALNPDNNARTKGYIAKALLAADTINLTAHSNKQNEDDEARRAATRAMLDSPNAVLIAQRESLYLTTKPTTPTPIPVDPETEDEIQEEIDDAI